MADSGIMDCDSILSRNIIMFRNSCIFFSYMLKFDEGSLVWLFFSKISLFCLFHCSLLEFPLFLKHMNSAVSVNTDSLITSWLRVSFRDHSSAATNFIDQVLICFLPKNIFYLGIFRLQANGLCCRNSAESVLRSRSLMICGRLLSSGDMFSMIGETSKSVPFNFHI